MVPVVTAAMQAETTTSIGDLLPLIAAAEPAAVLPEETALGAAMPELATASPAVPPAVRARVSLMPFAFTRWTLACTQPRSCWCGENLSLWL